METKKTYEADLDNKRPLWFLLGMMLVLALFLTALEYTSGGSDESYADSDEMLNDLDFLANLEHREVTIAPQPAPANTTQAQPQPTDKPEAVTAEDLLNSGSSNQATTETAVDGAKAELSTPVPTTETTDKDAILPTDKPLNFRVVQEIPMYPGGMSALVKWLTDNLNYPAKARVQKIEGRVVVTFIINTDGSISDAKVATSVHPLLDREAMRLIRQMPKWKPGIENGKPCRTLFAIPIVFKL